MLSIEPLEEIIKLVLYSGHIKNGHPVSVLIIAAPESGKTELVKEFKQNDGVAYLTDATAYGITKTLLPELEMGKLKHIIIPDLLIPLSKSKSTVNSFVAFMNSLIEEGVAEIQTYATSIKKAGLKCGLIGCITKSELMDKRHRWTDMGFLSRMIPLSYGYSQITIIEILKWICEEQHLQPKSLRLKLPKAPKTIKLDKRLSEQLIPYSTTLAKAGQVYGFRLQRQFQELLKASALEAGRNAVNASDIERLLKLMRFINLDFNQV